MSQQTFFDNNEGLISPDGHRKYNEAVIDTMAMDEDVQLLADPSTPKHAQPTVVDEVLTNKFGSWDRSNNHVAHIPIWGNLDVVKFPIGEVATNYFTTKNGTEMFRRTFGPAVKFFNGEYYFSVFQAGAYVLVQKKIVSGPPYHKSVHQEINVTEEQAANGYKIIFDDGVTSSTVLNGSGKNLRTYTRLYYETGNVYQNVNYTVPIGVTFKYHSDPAKPNAIAGGKDVLMAVYAVKAHAPLLTRQGRNITIRSMIRPELKLRPTFMAKMNTSINMELFIEPNRKNDGSGYEVWHKKSKTWHYRFNGKRKTHRIVGYIKTKHRTAEEIMKKGLRPTELQPQFIDFQIRMKNAEKTVVAQYRATYEKHLDNLGNPIEYGIVFRKR